MHNKRLFYVVALELGMTTALLGLLQTARAAPDDLFAKLDGSDTACTQANDDAGPARQVMLSVRRSSLITKKKE